MNVPAARFASNSTLRFAAGALALGLLLSATPARVSALSAQSNGGTLTATTFVDVAKKVLPAVVSIEVDPSKAPKAAKKLDEAPNSPRERLRRFQEEFQREFQFQLPGQMPELPEGQRNAGSGFIVAVKDEIAYVVTNNHVVQNAPEGSISVILDVSMGEKKFAGAEVEVASTDDLSDLAVLKVKIGKTEVKTAEWGDSDAVDVGEWVVALGNPLELRNSVTNGIVSAKHREIDGNGFQEFLQTTATINPGNSGGPLVNLDGQVVGINNAIKTRTGLWQGIGFAIPANNAKRVVEQIIEHGKIQRGFLGVEMGDLDERLAEYFSIEKNEGVFVRKVHKGFPAAKAGIRQNDIVVAIDGKKVKDSSDLLRAIANKNVGETVRLEILRDSNESEAKLKKLSVEVTLAERPKNDDLASIGVDGPGKAKPQKEARPEGVLGQLGITLEPVEATDETPKGLRILTVAPGTPIDRAGLRPGDVITQINRRNVATIEAFRKAAESSGEGGKHRIMYSRDGRTDFAYVETQTDEENDSISK